MIQIAKTVLSITYTNKTVVAPINWHVILFQYIFCLHTHTISILKGENKNCQTIADIIIWDPAWKQPISLLATGVIFIRGFWQMLHLKRAASAPPMLIQCDDDRFFLLVVFGKKYEFSFARIVILFLTSTTHTPDTNLNKYVHQTRAHHILLIFEWTLVYLISFHSQRGSSFGEKYIS